MMIDVVTTAPGAMPVTGLVEVGTRMRIDAALFSETWMRKVAKPETDAAPAETAPAAAPLAAKPEADQAKPANAKAADKPS